MAFGHGINARYYYNALDWSAFIEEADPGLERATSEVKPLSVDWVQQVQGHRRMTIGLKGIYAEDYANGGAIEDNAWDAFDDGVAHVFAYLPQGDAAGRYGYCGKSNLGSVSITVGDDAVKMPVSAISSNQYDRCVILYPKTHTEADANGASQNGGSASTDGLRAYVILFDIDAATAVVVKLQDSADNNTWADISGAATASLTAAGDALIETSGAVRQYVRAVIDITGAGHCTPFVAFARK